MFSILVYASRRLVLRMGTRDSGRPVTQCIEAGFFSSNATFSAPSNPNQISTIPSATNILHVSVHSFCGEEPLQLLFVSTADKQLHLLATNTTFSIYKSLPYVQDSPILSCISLGGRSTKTITTGMSGQVVLYDHARDMVSGLFGARILQHIMFEPQATSRKTLLLLNLL